MLKFTRIFILCFILIMAIFFAIDFFYVNSGNVEFRRGHFDSSLKIVENFKGKNQPALLTDVFSKVYDSYTAKLSAMYLNMTICIGLCVLGIIIVRRKKNIEVPGFNTIRIPIQISYLVIPAALCYYWIRFGVLLHDIIGARLELFTIIQANYLNQFSISDISQITFSDYFTYTPVNTLKDSGFIDSWFLFFQPSSFPISDIGFTPRILFWLTIILVGFLYGIAQGFAMGLPYNWLFRYKTSSSTWRILCAVLLFVNTTLILVSHVTFYFGVKNYNWVQFPMLLSTALSFLIITSNSVRDHYKKLVVHRTGRRVQD